MEKQNPGIAPLLINDQLATDFKEKANKFNEFFSFKCTPIDNGSITPIFFTNARLSTILFDGKDLKIVRCLYVKQIT